MNIGIYNTYFESTGFGGGERYMLTAAVHWAEKHTVSIICDNPKLPELALKRFGLDTRGIQFVPNFFVGDGVIQKILKSRVYDVLFMLTDGSIPMSFAKKNIFHVQVPFPKLPFHPLKKIHTVVCNSEFTRKHLDQRVDARVVIIYPPVDVASFMIGKKEKIILSAGRFHQLKKQDVLIEAFKKLNGTSWKLVLAGGFMESDREYYSKLKSQAKGLNIEFHTNIAFSDLQILYATSFLYWHAAGYGEDNPINMEHFGITTVEAMASGCIPLVYNGGGLPEIVEDGKTGFLWTTLEELIQKTKRTITEDLVVLRSQVVRRAGDFSVDRFTKAIDTLL